MPAIEYATLADRDELLAFLLGVFRRQRPDHPPFEALYPDLFQDEATIGCHAVVRDAGRIVACVGAYPIPLRVAGLDIPTAGFGQVATSPDHLGRGYMTALMKAQLARLRDAGAVVAWLGGRHDRYAHFGFESAGWNWSCNFDAHSLAPLPRRHAVRRLDAAPAEVFTDDLWAIRQTFPHCPREPLETFRLRLRREHKLELWTAAPEEGAAPVAYAVLSREWKSLADWAGPADAVLEILASAMPDAAYGRISASLPPSSPASELFRRYSFYVGIGPQTVAVLDREGLLRAYAPLIPAGTPPPPADLGPGALANYVFGPEPHPPFPQLPFFIPGLYHV